MAYSDLGNKNVRVYFQNGVDNSPPEVVKSAQSLSKVLGEPAGYIYNATHGVAADTVEYLPEGLSLKDALNEQTYREINAKGPTLVVIHSAGNEDAKKALEVGAALGHSYDNLSVISVGSPVSAKTLQSATEQTGATFLGQVNDWKDPVTYSKTAATSALGLTGTGGLIGIQTGINISAPWGLAAGPLGGFAAGLIGGAVGGGSILLGIKTYHPFEQYLKKPQAQSIIFDWKRAQEQKK